MKTHIYFSLDRFGEKLRYCRKERKMTQKELADAIGVEVDQVRKYEYGLRLPSMEHLVAIIVVFEKPLFFFIDVDDELMERMVDWEKSKLIPFKPDPKMLAQAVADALAHYQEEVRWLKSRLD